MIQAMSTELFLDFIGIRMDSRKAEGLAFKINLITPDNGEKFAVELANATLTNVEGFLYENPDLTLTLDRNDLEPIMMGQIRFSTAIENGSCKAEGNIDILAQLGAMLVTFDPGFEILPGTAVGAAQADLNPYSVQDESLRVRGE